MNQLDTIDDLLSKDEVCARLGVERVAPKSGTVALRLRVTDAHLNFGGLLHGGVIFTLADTAMGLASNGFGRIAVAVDTHMAFSGRAEVGDVLTAEARVVSQGRRLSTYRVDVTDGERVLGTFDGTVFDLGERP